LPLRRGGKNKGNKNADGKKRTQLNERLENGRGGEKEGLKGFAGNITLNGDSGR